MPRQLSSRNIKNRPVRNSKKGCSDLWTFVIRGTFRKFLCSACPFHRSKNHSQVPSHFASLNTYKVILFYFIFIWTFHFHCDCSNCVCSDVWYLLFNNFVSCLIVLVCNRSFDVNILHINSKIWTYSQKCFKCYRGLFLCQCLLY